MMASLSVEGMDRTKSLNRILSSAFLPLLPINTPRSANLKLLMSRKFQPNAKKTHLSRLAPRVVVSARVVMPVRAMPSANKILCHTTTSTLDNTWVEFIGCF